MQVATTTSTFWCYTPRKQNRDALSADALCDIWERKPESYILAVFVSSAVNVEGRLITTPKMIQKAQFNIMLLLYSPINYSGFAHRKVEVVFQKLIFDTKIGVSCLVWLSPCHTKISVSCLVRSSPCHAFELLECTFTYHRKKPLIECVLFTKLMNKASIPFEYSSNMQSSMKDMNNLPA